VGPLRDHEKMEANRWCDVGHEPVGWCSMALGDDCWFCGHLFRTQFRPSVSVPSALQNPARLDVGANPSDLPSLDDPDYRPVSISGV